MRVKTDKKTRQVMYTWKGDVNKELQRCKDELESINEVLPNFKWAYEDAKREYESKLSRKSDLEDFIDLVERKQAAGEPIGTTK